MAGIWDGIGTGVAQGVLNAGFGELGKWTNFLWNEKSAQNAYNRQREFYEDYQSWAAQMRQLKEAGLSPSMLIGGAPGATGGTSTAQGAGAQGPAGQFFHLDPKLRAEIDLLDSQKNLNNAEAENLGQDTDNKKQEYLNLVQKLKNDKVYNRILVAQAELEECNADLAWATFQTNLEQAYYNTRQAAAGAISAEVKADLDETTFDAAYQMAWAELDKTLTDAALNRAEIQLTKGELNQIAWNIWQIQKEQYRKDKQFNQDINNMKNHVKLELMKLNQGAEEISAEVSQAKINAVAHIVGSLFNFGGTAIAAKTYASSINAPKTSISTTYDGKGRTKRTTITDTHR